MKKIRILLIDDHLIVRQGIKSIIQNYSEFEIIGEASNGEEALKFISVQNADIVLMDLKLPDIDGTDLIQRIHTIAPDCAVLVLTAYINPSLVNACLQAGARGYLLKDAENLNLREHLLAMAQGLAAYDPRAASMLTDLARNPRADQGLLKLREIEILRLTAQGLSNKEISQQLNLSDHTIKGYMKDIFNKMGVNNRTEAVMKAKERGLI